MSDLNVDLELRNQDIVDTLYKISAVKQRYSTNKHLEKQSHELKSLNKHLAGLQKEIKRLTEEAEKEKGKPSCPHCGGKIPKKRMPLCTHCQNSLFWDKLRKHPFPNETSLHRYQEKRESTRQDQIAKAQKRRDSKTDSLNENRGKLNKYMLDVGLRSEGSTRFLLKLDAGTIHLNLEPSWSRYWSIWFASSVCDNAWKNSTAKYLEPIYSAGLLSQWFEKPIGTSIWFPPTFPIHSPVTLSLIESCKLKKKRQHQTVKQYEWLCYVVQKDSIDQLCISNKKNEEVGNAIGYIDARRCKPVLDFLISVKSSFKKCPKQSINIIDVKQA
jgi:hypothetical protein